MLNKIAAVNFPYAYLGAASLLIMWSLPNKAFKVKIFLSLPLILSYLRFEDSYWLTFILIELLVIYTAIVISDFIRNEFKVSKQASIFFILLLIDQILNIFKVLFYFYDAALSVASAPFMLLSGVILYTSIAIIGPDRKIALPSLFIWHFENDAAITFTDKEKLVKGTDEKYSGGNGLTEIDQQILKLIAENHTSTEIADKIHLSKKTIDKHRHDIRRKLNLPPKADLKSVSKKLFPNNNDDNISS
ncbi:MAG: helix-turn-helix transcriptional regulator [Ignavibacteriales bacterium]|nr:helix-turn-helix transcriptional regulator [Ignavibacteriales bacterium]